MTKGAGFPGKSFLAWPGDDIIRSVWLVRLPCSAGSTLWLNRYEDPEVARFSVPNDVPTPFEVGGPGSGVRPTLVEGFRPLAFTGITAVAPSRTFLRAGVTYAGPFFRARCPRSFPCPSKSAFMCPAVQLTPPSLYYKL